MRFFNTLDDVPRLHRHARGTCPSATVAESRYLMQERLKPFAESIPSLLVYLLVDALRAPAPRQLPDGVATEPGEAVFDLIEPHLRLLVFLLHCR